MANAVASLCSWHSGRTNKTRRRKCQTLRDSGGEADGAKIMEKRESRRRYTTEQMVEILW